MNRSARGTAGDILDAIIATKREEVRKLEPQRVTLRAAAEARAGERSGWRGTLVGDRVRVIAEVKRRSPSAGWIQADAAVSGVARTYAEGGAAAVSVLTDAEYFGGALEDLRAVRNEVGVPVLRKDFIVDPLQVWEAKAAGADAVLLIVRVLGDPELREHLSLCAELGLGVLVEVHDAQELERALAAGAPVVGINNRDLATFRTDLSVTLALAPLVPADRVVVAESGIASAEDVRRVAGAGAHAVLVGEALMRADSPASLLGELAGVPRPGAGSAAATGAV